jgi:hypothetical protein
MFEHAVLNVELLNVPDVNVNAPVEIKASPCVSVPAAESIVKGFAHDFVPHVIVCDPLPS